MSAEDDYPDILIEDAAIEWQGEMVRRFSDTVSRMAYQAATVSGTNLVTLEVMQDAAVVVSQSKPNYLEL